jgi:hypothetical protein
MHQFPGFLELLKTYFPPHAHITDMQHLHIIHTWLVMSRLEKGTSCFASNEWGCVCVFGTLIYAPELVSKVRGTRNVLFQ